MLRDGRPVPLTDWTDMRDDDVPAAPTGGDAEGSAGWSDPREPAAEMPHPARRALGLAGAGRAGTAMAGARAQAGHRGVAAAAGAQAALKRDSPGWPEGPVVPV